MVADDREARPRRRARRARAQHAGKVLRGAAVRSADRVAAARRRLRAARGASAARRRHRAAEPGRRRAAFAPQRLPAANGAAAGAAAAIFPRRGGDRERGGHLSPHPKVRLRQGAGHACHVGSALARARPDGARSMTRTIWLSSYPKSGNTWFRMLVANLNAIDTPVDINALPERGGIASARAPFDHLTLIDSGLLTHDEID